jgi:hypothetical protein
MLVPRRIADPQKKDNRKRKLRSSMIRNCSKRFRSTCKRGEGTSITSSQSDYREDLNGEPEANLSYYMKQIKFAAI